MTVAVTSAARTAGLTTGFLPTGIDTPHHQHFQKDPITIICDPSHQVSVPKRFFSHPPIPSSAKNKLSSGQSLSNRLRGRAITNRVGQNDEGDVGCSLDAHLGD